MSSNTEQSSNAQQGSSSSTNINSVAIAPPTLNTQTSTSSNTEIPPGNESGSDLNTSIGSQRSLNSRIFPTSFRISRDIILNNVSHKLNVKIKFEKIISRLSMSTTGFSRNSATRSKFKFNECSLYVLDEEFLAECQYSDV